MRIEWVLTTNNIADSTVKPGFINNITNSILITTSSNGEIELFKTKAKSNGYDKKYLNVPTTTKEIPTPNPNSLQILAFFDYIRYGIITLAEKQQSNFEAITWWTPLGARPESIERKKLNLTPNIPKVIQQVTGWLQTLFKLEETTITPKIQPPEETLLGKKVKLKGNGCIIDNKPITIP